MKIEQIIDEIQASLTKLRGQLRNEGKAETATEAVMREDTDRRVKHFHDCRDLYNWLNGKTDIKPPIVDKIFKKVSDPTPDLPLNVEVARALDHVIWTDPAGNYRYAPTTRFIPEGCEYPLVPDYPHNWEAIDQAASTYFDKFDLKWGVCHLPDPIDEGYYQAYYFRDANKDRDKFVCGATAAEALSRLVVLHAEAR